MSGIATREWERFSRKKAKEDMTDVYSTCLKVLLADYTWC